MTSTLHIEVCDVDDVKFVRFQDRRLFDEKTINEVANEITASLPAPGSPIHLVLDFSEVALISTSLLSKLLVLRRRIKASQGTLRLCGMSENLRSVFRTSNLDGFFQIDSRRPTVFASF